MFIRSLIFKMLFYGLTALYVFVLIITLFWPNYKGAYRGIALWANFVVWLLRVIVGIKVEIRGQENLPKEGTYIVAPKHESTLDAFLAIRYVPLATALAKKEIFYFPVLGFILLKLGAIPVNRQKGDAHKKLPSVGELILKSQRPILVFPEGTRVPIGHKKDLKPGAYFLQHDHNLPVYTSATSAGYFWPSNKFLMKKGTVVWEIHEAMPSNLSKEDFMIELENRIIGRSDQLKIEAANTGE